MNRLTPPAILIGSNTIRRPAMPMKNPPHPGDLIKTEIVEALGLNVSKAGRF
jgi:hypothetical protein